MSDSDRHTERAELSNRCGMNDTKIKYGFSLILLTCIIAGSGIAYAQSTRSTVNKGVELYKKDKYVDSEVEFKKALEKSPDNFQANFNIGDSYYKEGKYEDALKSYASALAKTKNPELKSKAYHNIGNALLQSKKIKESIGAYADALKLNPNDDSTKYNLSYALNLLKNQDKNKKQQNKNDKNNKNNKNDKNKQNQNNQQNNKNKDQNKQNQQQNQQQNQDQQNKQNQSKQDQMKQPDQNKITKAQAQAILNALNNDEKDLQKKLRKMKGTPIKTDKDW